MRKLQTAFILFAWLMILSPGSAAIVINEVHYAPSDRTVPEEFIELYNSGDSVVDLSGWYFSDGVDFTFPDGTTLGPGEYLVVAQDPAVLTSLYGAFTVLGPFHGRLSNHGESLILRNSQGGREDEVDYRRGFPWPTVGGTAGYSMELIHPELDNDLGGSWRASSSSLDDSSNLVRAGEAWRYFKGTEEASDPMAAWRQVGFDDSSWDSGVASIGYGEGFISTVLDDMRNNYSTVYLRKTFEVADPATVRNLTLEVMYDDGFNAWINGVHVADANVPGAELEHTRTANSALESHDYHPFTLPNPAGYIVAGSNVLAMQLHNASVGGSSDAFIDVRLTSSASGGNAPTPGALNAIYATNAPPHLRQVGLLFEEPVSGEPVLVTAKATDDDGVASLELEYQVVEPGSYIELGDAAYETDWTPVNMNDEGIDGDLVAFDDIWTVLLPGELQAHRRLIRYRITATDAAGLSVRAPYADDPVPNFAYFVYDGIPGWSGAIQPGSGDATRGEVVDYPPELMASVPAYHLITKRSSTEDCTWNSRYGGDNYRWQGTLVAHGKVYDHVRYRARGGVWRYSMGKNMWKFDFHRGHSFEAWDDFGRKIDTTWDKLNFSAIIQQGNFRHRGEQGLFEATGFRLFNLMGVEASKTYYLTYRIIDEVDEFSPTQYAGDLWGLYLVLEQMDGRFLDEHNLPDGNLYKMEGWNGTLNNQGPTAATDRSDLRAFLDTYNDTTPSDDWWRENLDLDRYYGYRCVVEGIQHYDIGAGKNYFYYLNPETDIWSVLPWDLDLTWNVRYGGGNEPFKSRVLTRPVFNLAYQNRMREFRDLLYNPDQMNQMLEEYAAMVDDPGGAPSLVDVDRSLWDYNPVLIDESIIRLDKAGHGRFYERGTPQTFQGMVEIMKGFVVSRGSWIDSNIANDSEIPSTPTITYIGPAGYPIDALTFRSSAFSDPQGAGTFAAMKWRVAEVAPAGAPPYDPDNPRPFEINPTWESVELASFQSELTIPSSVLKIGHTYRARVRMKDSTDRWSHWSAEVEFVAGEPTVPFAQQTYLRITEVMYHPTETQDLEFVELQNIGPDPLDLSTVSFTDGIEFDFANGDIQELPPGEFVLVVKDLVVFSSLYDTASMNLAGEFSRNLSNAGENVVLTYGGNAAILDFDYLDTWYPLTDGGGYSLVVIDPEGPPQSWGDPLAWKKSEELGGSPGAPDGGGPVGGRQLPGDSNQDGILEISDALSLLVRVLPGGELTPPCNGAVTSGGNLLLLDSSGDGVLNVTDVLHLLNFLFLNGPPHDQGVYCRRLVGCPSTCTF